MKGKIFHKRKLPIELSLREYLKALENLLAQGAGPLPKKISFNSPQGSIDAQKNINDIINEFFL